MEFSHTTRNLFVKVLIEHPFIGLDYPAFSEELEIAFDALTRKIKADVKAQSKARQDRDTFLRKLIEAKRKIAREGKTNLQEKLAEILRVTPRYVQKRSKELFGGWKQAKAAAAELQEHNAMIEEAIRKGEREQKI